MTDQFVAEIRILPFNFPPTGWASCNGQVLPIAQNTALFSLLGTTYGGDGISNFALPNLQGQVVVGQGQGPGLSLYELGQQGGEMSHTLVTNEMPAHNHMLGVSSTAGSLTTASNATAIGAPPTPAFGTPYNMAPMAGQVGGSQAHNNMQPYLTLNFCIALQGIYPARS
jgi:microcystin-dependent protein